jgi:hypothetical protein
MSITRKLEVGDRIVANACSPMFFITTVRQVDESGVRVLHPTNGILTYRRDQVYFAPDPDELRSRCKVILRSRNNPTLRQQLGLPVPGGAFIGKKH